MLVSAECAASLALILVLAVLPLSSHYRRDSVFLFPDAHGMAETFFLKGEYNLAAKLLKQELNSLETPETLEKLADCLALQENPNMIESSQYLLRAGQLREDYGQIDRALFNYLKVLSREREAIDIPQPSAFGSYSTYYFQRLSNMEILRNSQRISLSTPLSAPQAYQRLLKLLEFEKSDSWKEATHVSLAEIFVEHVDNIREASYHISESVKFATPARLASIYFRFANTLVNKGYASKAIHWQCEGISSFLQSFEFNALIGPASSDNRPLSTTNRVLVESLFSLSKMYLLLNNKSNAIHAIGLAKKIDPSNLSVRFFHASLTNTWRESDFKRTYISFVERRYDSLVREAVLASRLALAPTDKSEFLLPKFKKKQESNVINTCPQLTVLMQYHLEHTKNLPESDLLCSFPNDEEEEEKEQQLPSNISPWVLCPQVPVMNPTNGDLIALPMASFSVALALYSLFMNNTRTISGYDQLYDILDLGCGTGIVGYLFRGLSNWITGVDISSVSLQIANRHFNFSGSSLYDGLEKKDILAYLKSEKVKERSLDVITLSDVLPSYGGHVESLFDLLSRSLREGGALLLSFAELDSYNDNAEHREEDHYVLTDDGEWLHRTSYILSSLEQANFFIQQHENIPKAEFSNCNLVHEGHTIVKAQQKIIIAFKSRSME